MLSQLAYTTFESSNYFFKQKDAKRLIESYIENLPGARTDPEALRLDSEAVLKSIEAQHGLLVERARGIYSFSHLTFHEYFTARYIEQDDKLYPDLISHLTEKRWREVILLTVGMVRNADSLLLMMKSHIDGMLANDKKLQEFLDWVNRKARSVNASYKPATIRSFYLSFGISNDTSLFLSLSLCRSFSRALSQALDLDLDFSLSYALDPPLSRPSSLSSVFSHVLRLSRNLDPILERLLEGDIRELLNTLPDSPNDKNHFRQWWLENGSTWTEKLRAVMIEHRDIGHDWQFNDMQIELLQQYHDANQLLVGCLKSDCYVSRSVREEIEASLLLPMAELQQQFPNQCPPL
jgi:predicted NACHT family NTPase